MNHPNSYNSFFNINLSFCVLAFYFITYLVFYPDVILVSDELSYLHHALELLDLSDVNCIRSAVTGQCLVDFYRSYPPGNSFILSLFINFFSVKGIFLTGPLYITISFICMYKLLRSMELPDWPVLLIFLFLPALVLSRTIMSDLAGLAISAIFFHVFFNKKRSGKNYFLLGFVSALSLFFRDPIVLVFAPFLVTLIKDLKRLFILGAGVITGLLPRIAYSLILYGDPIKFIEGGNNFAAGNIPSNFLLYTVILLFLVPAGLFFIVRYKGRYKTVLQTTILLNVLFLSVYGYNAWHNSGSKVLILNGRYLLPLLPLIILSTGWYFKQSNQNPGKIISLLAGSLILFVAVLMDRHQQERLTVVSDIYRQESPVVITHNQVSQKFLNPLYGSREVFLAGAIPESSKTLDRKDSLFLYDFERRDTDYWRQMIKPVKPGNAIVVESTSFNLMDNIVVRKYRLR